MSPSDAAPAHVRAEITSDPRLLSAVRAMVNQVASRAGFNEHQCGQIALAVDEAICNIINHGYARRTDGRIWLSIWIEAHPPGLRIILEDQARQVDPSTIRSRDLADIRPGGLGVHIIREIMDVVHYECREETGMRLIMSKAVDSPARETGTDESHQTDAGNKEAT